MASYETGDTTWSVGCRAYALGPQRMRRVAERRTYNWLSVLDQSDHFVFLIQDVPLRFFRGSADEPTLRTLRCQHNEAQQLDLALGEDLANGLVFRLALETEAAEGMDRVMFLNPARRGGTGRVLLVGAARQGAGAGTRNRVGPDAAPNRKRRVLKDRCCRQGTSSAHQGGTLTTHPG